MYVCVCGCVRFRSIEARQSHLGVSSLLAKKHFYCLLPMKLAYLFTHLFTIVYNFLNSVLTTCKVESALLISIGKQRPKRQNSR